MLDISHLNEAQREAVTAPEGPVLVLAGAGSGKTRVLTYRIAYLIKDRGVWANQICALTFTNKAAAEMAERVNAIVPGEASALTVTTFHSLCARLLRYEAEYIGYKRDFVIYDDSDTLTLLKKVLKELNLAQEKHIPRLFRRLIDEAKNKLEGPGDVAPGEGPARRFPEVYARYQQRLKNNNALDFGDLIRLTVVLFETCPSVLRRYQERYRYLLVDEYQDTNKAQYRLTRLLSNADDGGHALCGPFVVGDEDQSIYAFRGANIQNILDFQKDFPQAVAIRLEQNYRSTETILKAANAVVAFNSQRLGKNLWSAQGKGEPIRLFEMATEREEASRVGEEMRRLRSQGFTFGDMAVFYRANALSRPFEEQLSRAGIPYKLVGQGFYSRKEIKDARAYIQLILNPLDDISLERVINTPTRGIGGKSVQDLYRVAKEQGLNAYDALGYISENPKEIGRAAPKLIAFYQMMQKLRERAKELGPQSLLVEVLAVTGYRARLEQEGSIESESRLSNLGELLSVASEFESVPGLLGLQGFLERIALRSSTDELPSDGGVVTLMTLHMAKGLEFPVVFLVGMEKGLFPNSRSEEGAALEEERRLCYVGMTRAMRRLYLTRALRRYYQGKGQMTHISCFIREIPPEHMVGRGQSRGVGHLAKRYGMTTSKLPPRTPRKTSPAWGKMPTAPRRPTIRSGGDDGPFEPFQVGREVVHAQLGEGRIIARDGSPDNPRLTIVFRQFGKKKIMAKMAQLEPIFS